MNLNGCMDANDSGLMVAKPSSVVSLWMPSHQVFLVFLIFMIFWIFGFLIFLVPHSHLNNSHQILILTLKTASWNAVRNTENGILECREQNMNTALPDAVYSIKNGIKGCRE